MDKINNISQILEIIRGHAKAGISDAKHNKTNSLEIEKTERPKRITKDELKKNISQKLKYASGTPDFTSKSKDIFLESVILWEFGDQLANDPLFREIKKNVKQTIDSNQDTAQKLQNLIEQLTSK